LEKDGIPVSNLLVFAFSRVPKFADCYGIESGCQTAIMIGMRVTENNNGQLASAPRP
jgi:hypothetical protein